MRRWNFLAGHPFKRVWTGVLCDKHEPWDDGHLKPRALASYMNDFPADLPAGTECVGFDHRSTPTEEPCFVCEHEGRQALLREAIAEMCEQDEPDAEVAMTSTPNNGVALVLDYAEGALRRGEAAADVAVSLGMLAGLADLDPEKLHAVRRDLNPDHQEMRRLITAVIAGVVSSEELGGVCRSLRVRTADIDTLLSEIREALPGSGAQRVN